MAEDARTRWLLLLILAGVAFLVVRDLAHGGAGRFTVAPLRAGSPVLVRTDTATGETWKLELRAGGERWVRIPLPGEPATPGSLELPAPAPPAPGGASTGAAPQRPLARDEIKALANAILGDELSPDIRFWAVGQLAGTKDVRATMALIQLLGAVDDPKLVALIHEALSQRDDPRAREALERFDKKEKAGS